MNECEVVQRADGSLLLSMRNYLGPNRRAFSTSTDEGISWSAPQLHEQVYCPTCQASLLSYPGKTDDVKNRILYSGPGGPGRTHLTLRVSTDGGETWPVAKVLYPGPSAYSDLVLCPDGMIGCLYERGKDHAYESITFARVPAAWLGAAEKDQSP